MYLYETHMHTAESSHCGASTGAEQVDFYKSLGYDGIFVTDHFLNGNCHVHHLPHDGSWQAQIELFCKGYENAKKRGDQVGLKVFFGFEYNYCSTEWLVYNLNKEWLLAHPEIMDIQPQDFLKLVKESGGIVIQAHPFREASYINCFRIYPENIDAIEVFNAHNSVRANKMAELFADEYGFVKSCGSDCHRSGDMLLCAMSSDVEICSAEDFGNLLKNNKLKLVTNLKGET